jgi:hypothetical protein
MTTTTAIYSRKKEGLTFEKFDDMIISWGRDKLFHLQHNYNYPVYYELYSMQVFSYILIT